MYTNNDAKIKKIVSLYKLAKFKSFIPGVGGRTVSAHFDCKETQTFLC